MAQPEDPEAADETRLTDEAEGTPRWVKMSGIVVLIVLAVFVILLVTGRGGDHGPGRHASFSATGTAASISAASEPASGVRRRP